MKIHYDREIPAEVLPNITAHLEALEWLIPAWCQTVSVGWGKDGDGDTLVQAWCDYDYRRATIEFYPCFLSEPQVKQRGYVTHEMLHAFTGILYVHAKQLIEKLLPCEDSEILRSVALEELRVRNEGLVQDLAFCIHQHETAKPVINRQDILAQALQAVKAKGVQSVIQDDELRLTRAI